MVDRAELPLVTREKPLPLLATVADTGKAVAETKSAFEATSLIDLPALFGTSSAGLLATPTHFKIGAT